MNSMLSEAQINEQTVKKSNFLIRSMYRRSLFENQIVMIALASSHKTIEKHSVCCQIPLEEIKQYINVNDRGLYQKLERAGKGLTSWKICAKDIREKGFFGYLVVITKAYLKDGILYLQFHQDLTEWITSLKTNYTKLSLKIMMSFKSMYSFRLYEMLLSHCYEKYFEGIENGRSKYRCSFDVAELRFYLGNMDAANEEVMSEISTNKNPDFAKIVDTCTKMKTTEDGSRVMGSETWAQFRRRIISPAVAEINSMQEDGITPLTDIYVDEEQIKTIRRGNGGRIDRIEFVVYKSDLAVITPKKELSEDEKLEFLSQVYGKFEGKLTIPQAAKLAQYSGYDMCGIERIAEKCRNRDDIQDLFAWAKAVIDNERIQDGQFCESPEWE